MRWPVAPLSSKEDCQQVAANFLQLAVERKTEELTSKVLTYSASAKELETLPKNPPKTLCDKYYAIQEAADKQTQSCGRVLPGGGEYLGRIDHGRSLCEFTFLKKHENDVTYWRIKFYRARDYWAPFGFASSADMEEEIEQDFMIVGEVGRPSRAAAQARTPEPSNRKR
jgi:hypothetical protein